MTLRTSDTESEYVRHNRRVALKRRYNMTLEDYDALLIQQNGLCALCDKPPKGKAPNGKRDARLYVDHCHKTGRIRGLLCYRCNSALGALGDTEENILKVLDYLNT